MTIVAPTISATDAAARMWDAIVIGAGPAGSVAARELARMGHRVLIVDRKAFPRPKTCGGCINGQALAILRHAGLGETIDALGGVPLERFTLHTKAGSVTLPLPGGVALSREVFDAALLQAAISAGAEFASECVAHVAPPPTGEYRAVMLRTSNGEFAAKASVIIVAAGLASFGVLKHSEIRFTAARGTRVGFGATTPEPCDAIEDGTIHMAVSNTGLGYAGLVRLESGLVGIAAAIDPVMIKVLMAGSNSESVIGRVFQQVGYTPDIPWAELRWHGTPELTQKPSKPAAARILLIGDAAGYVEPFTGEGIAWGLASALAVAPIAAQGIREWHPRLEDRWRLEHRRLIGRRQRLCRAIAFGLRKPGIVRAAARILRVAPSAAKPFVRSMSRTLHLEGAGLT